MAIHDRDGARARQLLEPARVYVMRDYSVWFLTAEFYLLTKQPAQAVEEFKSILANPGIDPLSTMYPLARLGLARAYAMEGRIEDSRSEYRKFLALRDHADLGIPAVIEGRREFERLGEPKN